MRLFTLLGENLTSQILQIFIIGTLTCTVSDTWLLLRWQVQVSQFCVLVHLSDMAFEHLNSKMYMELDINRSVLGHIHT